MPPVRIVLLIVAVVCFLFAAFAPPSRVNAGWLGLAAFVATFLL
jgi:hypothetical protein